MGLRCAAALLLALFSLVVSAQVEPLFDEGNRLLGAGDFEGALHRFDDGVRIEPNKAQWHWGRGLALEKLGRYGDAVAALDRSLRLDPGYHVAEISQKKRELDEEIRAKDAVRGLGKVWKSVVKVRHWTEGQSLFAVIVVGLVFLAVLFGTVLHLRSRGPFTAKVRPLLGFSGALLFLFSMMWLFGSELPWWPRSEWLTRGASWVVPLGIFVLVVIGLVQRLVSEGPVHKKAGAFLALVVVAAAALLALSFWMHLNPSG